METLTKDSLNNPRKGIRKAVDGSKLKLPLKILLDIDVVIYDILIIFNIKELKMGKVRQERFLYSSLLLWFGHHLIQKKRKWG